MSKLVLFAIAALGCLALAGCPAPENTAPAPTSAPPSKPGAKGGSKPSTIMSSDVEQAPPGVKTDLSGGLNGPKPK